MTTVFILLIITFLGGSGMFFLSEKEKKEDIVMGMFSILGFVIAAGSLTLLLIFGLAFLSQWWFLLTFAILSLAAIYCFYQLEKERKGF